MPFVRFSLGHLAGSNGVDLSRHCPSLPVLRSNSTPVANTVEPSGVCVFCSTVVGRNCREWSGGVVGQAKSFQPMPSLESLKNRQCNSDNYRFLGVHHSSFMSWAQGQRSWGNHPPFCLCLSSQTKLRW